MTINKDRKAKACAICTEVVDIDDFAVRKDTSDKRDNVCKLCANVESQLRTMKKNGDYEEAIDKLEIKIIRLRNLSHGMSVRQAAKYELDSF